VVRVGSWRRQGSQRALNEARQGWWPLVALGWHIQMSGKGKLPAQEHLNVESDHPHLYPRLALLLSSLAAVLAAWKFPGCLIVYSFSTWSHLPLPVPSLARPRLGVHQTIVKLHTKYAMNAPYHPCQLLVSVTAS